MAQITKDTVIGDILDIAPNTAPIFPRGDGGAGLHGSRCGCGRAAGKAQRQHWLIL